MSVFVKRQYEVVNLDNVSTFRVKQNGILFCGIGEDTSNAWLPFGCERDAVQAFGYICGFLAGVPIRVLGNLFIDLDEFMQKEE